MRIGAEEVGWWRRWRMAGAVTAQTTSMAAAAANAVRPAVTSDLKAVEHPGDHDLSVRRLGARDFFSLEQRRV